MKKYFLTLLIIGALCRSANAAIQSHDELTWGILSNAQAESLTLKSPENIREIKFKPNLGGTLGLLASFRWLTLSIMSSKALPPPGQENKGKSTYDDFRGGFYLGHQKQFYFFGGYARYNGFHIENSQSIDPSLAANDQYLTLNDLELKKFAGSVTFVTHPENYSLASALSQLSRQTESGGSWKLKLDLSSLVISNANQEIIPSSQQSFFGNEAKYKGGKFNNLNFLGGYGYNWILAESWFFHLSMMLGPGYTFGDYDFGSQSRNMSETALATDVNINFGYNGPRFFTSINLMMSSHEFQTGSVRNSEQTNMGNLTLGYRTDIF